MLSGHLCASTRHEVKLTHFLFGEEWMEKGHSVVGGGGEGELCQSEEGQRQRQGRWECPHNQDLDRSNKQFLQTEMGRLSVKAKLLAIWTIWRSILVGECVQLKRKDVPSFSDVWCQMKGLWKFSKCQIQSVDWAIIADWNNWESTSGQLLLYSQCLCLNSILP